MLNIFVIGDSHCVFFNKSSKINHHWLGWANLPVSMYAFNNTHIPLLDIVSYYRPGDVCKINIKPNDYVFFSFGWNDVQKQFNIHNKDNYKQMINEMVSLYIKKLCMYKTTVGIIPVACIVYPATTNETMQHITGTIDERIIYTNYINKIIIETASVHDIPVYDINSYISTDNIINKELLSHDNTHLDHDNVTLMTFMENEIFKICYPDEVTLFITSCGRSDLLKITLESFVKFNTYPIKQCILCEDSDQDNSFVLDIIPYPIIFKNNDKRLGQMKTIELYTPLIDTDYVFHLEDDYEFFKHGFIEVSLDILKTDCNISQVLLEQAHYKYPRISIENTLCTKIQTNSVNDIHANNGDGPLDVFSWRPSLKRLTVAKLRMPYELWDDEYTIQLQLNKLKMYSVIINNSTGFCRNIGDSRHVSLVDKHVKIYSRLDFPNKINIRLKDI
jgi:hypothetical protein